MKGLAIFVVLSVCMLQVYSHDQQGRGSNGAGARAVGEQSGRGTDDHHGRGVGVGDQSGRGVGDQQGRGAGDQQGRVIGEPSGRMIQVGPYTYQMESTDVVKPIDWR